MFDCDAVDESLWPRRALKPCNVCMKDTQLFIQLIIQRLQRETEGSSVQ